jgi:RNA polymerase sigma-70 factor (ECF subfamily)
VASKHQHAGDLVLRWQAGDHQALHELVELLRPILLRQAFVVLRDEAGAEDVFVETMSALLERLPTLHDPAAALTYARRIARTRAIDTLRRREYRDSRAALRGASDLGAREPDRKTAPIERLGGATSPETRALAAERVARVRAAIDGLAEPGRALMTAVCLRGDSLAAAAAALELPESSARRALQRARALVAARLAGFEAPRGGAA